jgi:hypothetical protein
MISQILNSFTLGFTFIVAINRRYPQLVQTLLIDISLKCIYIYSKLQIFAFKLNEQINKIIETSPALLKLKNYINSLVKCKLGKVLKYEFIKDGKILDFYDYDRSCLNNDEKYFINKFNFYSVNEPDLIICSWPDNYNKCVNKEIIYENGHGNLAKVSDIKFILIEIKIGESEPHKIDLKTDKFNYYLVGNKFTKSFFIFYLKHYLKVDNITSDTQMRLKIIDDDLNIIEIDFTDKNESITLEKNGYKL